MPRYAPVIQGSYAETMRQARQAYIAVATTAPRALPLPSISAQLHGVFYNLALICGGSILWVLALQWFMIPHNVLGGGGVKLPGPRVLEKQRSVDRVKFAPGHGIGAIAASSPPGTRASRFCGTSWSA